MIDYIVEESCNLKDFPFWSGAKDRANRINERSDADEIWRTLETYFNDEASFSGNPITDTFINDCVWFELDSILGFNIFDDEDEDDV